MGNAVPQLEALLLLGPTGSGKTPLGGLFESRGIGNKKCHHFDFGHELRSLAGCPSPPEGFSTSEIRFVRQLIREGLLLEDEHFSLAAKLFTAFLGRRHCREEDIVLLNGLPRHEGQAVRMSEFVHVARLVVLDCCVPDLQARIGRNTGGDRADRTDDTEALIEKKLALFTSRTACLIDHYAGRGASITRLPVGADSTPESDFARLLEMLNR